MNTEANKITKRHTFACIDGHTCGNPVRLVLSGHPHLAGITMSERRQDFIKRFDWVRTSLMYEPRGHEIMSGAFLYPPTRKDCDTGILYIEVSGCLPMCGHGTIGAVTLAIEEGILRPKKAGFVRLDTPAGVVEAYYTKKGRRVEDVRIHNVASYLAVEGAKITCPGLGDLFVDIAFGGNFYAIIDPQKNYKGLDAFNVSDIQRFSPLVRNLINKAVRITHPEDKTIKSISHVQWTDRAKNRKAHSRNAVFYGDRAIDRSPCGTGTSARMAQLAAKGKLHPGETFIHESIIGSLFEGRIEETTKIGKFDAIRPSIKGWAKTTAHNTIYVDPGDPFWRGFVVK